MDKRVRGLKLLIAIFGLAFIYGIGSSILDGWDIGATIGCICVGSFLMLAVFELLRIRRAPGRQ